MNFRKALMVCLFVGLVASAHAATYGEFDGLPATPAVTSLDYAIMRAYVTKLNSDIPNPTSAEVLTLAKTYNSTVSAVANLPSVTNADFDGLPATPAVTSLDYAIMRAYVTKVNSDIPNPTAAEILTLAKTYNSTVSAVAHIPGTTIGSSSTGTGTGTTTATGTAVTIDIQTQE